jgi:hypothetical protein
MAVSIKKIEGSGGSDIEDFVLRSPGSILYSSPHYLALISNHLNATCGWFVASDGDDIKGALPFAFKDGDLGSVWNSMPFYGSNGGVVQATPDLRIKKELIREFYEFAERANACSATIITNPLLKDHEDYESSIEGFLRDVRIGQITHLPESSGDELMKIFQDPRPRNIRRAIKEGIEVANGNEKSSVEFLYEVHVENMKAIGGLAKPWDFFEKLSSGISEDFWSVYLGSLNGEPIAALLLFYFNGTVEYFTPVIKPEHRNTQALALVIYEAMKDAVSKKQCNNWNWGGTWLSQGGVYDFKKRWGTSDYPYYYYTKLFHEGVRSSSKEALLANYPGFYVLPFSELKETENE